eukprot:scaffold599513_cov37-Prasinocladus_malaysianus.AAC.1
MMVQSVDPQRLFICKLQTKYSRPSPALDLLLLSTNSDVLNSIGGTKYPLSSACTGCWHEAYLAETPTPNPRPPFLLKYSCLNNKPAGHTIEILAL